MKTYRIVWTIEVEAENPLEAAREALGVQRAEDSEALHFEVKCPDTDKLIANVDLLYNEVHKIKED